MTFDNLMFMKSDKGKKIKRRLFLHVDTRKVDDAKHKS